MQLSHYLWYCHRLPSRSFWYRGKPFPVCARCTGIWIGYVVGLPLILWLQPHWLISLVLALPAILDGGSQLLRWRESNNVLRVITGILLGLGEMIVIIKLFNWIAQFGYVVGTRLINSWYIHCGGLSFRYKCGKQVTNIQHLPIVAMAVNIVIL